MSHTLCVPRIHLEQDVRALLDGTATVRRPLTLLTGSEGNLKAFSTSGDDKAGPVLQVVPIPPEAGADALPPGLGSEVVAVLAVGLDASLEGLATGWMRHRAGLFDCDVRLCFPGPGMVEMLPPREQPPALRAEEREQWSRTMAALGTPAVDTMRRLSLGIVGLGRLGGALLHYLASLPVRRLVLVDGDRIERHNLGEGVYFGETEIGLGKTQAHADRLALWHPKIEVVSCAGSVTDTQAMDALAECDAVFSVPDNPGARLALRISKRNSMRAATGGRNGWVRCTA